MQLPINISQAKRAIHNLGSLKCGNQKYLPVHTILCTLNRAAKIAHLIKSNVELLSVDQVSGITRMTAQDCHHQENQRDHHRMAMDSTTARRIGSSHVSISSERMTDPG